MITASIVTYNHHLLDFEPVLRSLFASPVDVVYVVDHSDIVVDLKAELQEFSTKVMRGEPYLQEKRNSGFKLVYIPHENNGYGGGHNVALRKAKEQGSEFHLVVNPDVWFGPEVIPALVGYMREHKDVGNIMPKVLYPNGAVQRLAKMLPSPMDMLGRFCLPDFVIFRRNNKFELRQSGFTKTMDVPFLSGCFMFLRTSILDTVGYFDERFFMYGEDVDFSRRIYQQYHNVYLTNVTIYHTFTRGSRKSLRLLMIHILSMVKYFNKWGWFRDKERRRINREVEAQIEDKL